MLDTIIRGGNVVSPDSTERFDVGVKDGRIVVFAEENSVDLEAARTIDAHGMYLVPGGIDAHVHFNVALSPVMRAQSATFGGRAAAFGGTTTFIDFALQSGEHSLVRAIEDKQVELKSDKPDIDYALHAMITGKATLEVLDEIPDAISGGVRPSRCSRHFPAVQLPARRLPMTGGSGASCNRPRNMAASPWCIARTTA